MDSASELLARRRLNAALASGGRSSSSIHGRAWKALASRIKSGTVCDFGAGKGTFANRLAEVRGLQVLAIDITERPADLSPDVQWLRADLNERLPVESMACSAVVSIEVIEHLENPRATFRELYRVLRPGGVVVLTTPNCENIRSYIALLIKRHHWAFTDSSYPAHITAFLERDLGRSAAEAGFVSLEWHYDGPGRVPGLTRLSWQSLSCGLLHGRLFCDNVLFIAHRPIDR